MTFIERRKKFFEQGTSVSSTSNDTTPKSPPYSSSELRGSDQSKEQKASYDKILQEKELEIKDLRKKLEDLEFQSSKGTSNLSESDAEEMRLKISYLESTKHTLTENIASLQNQLERCQSHLSSTVKEKNALENKLEMLKKENSRLVSERNVREHEEYKRICAYADQLQGRVETLENDKYFLQMEYDKMKDVYHDEKEELKLARNKQATLASQLQEENMKLKTKLKAVEQKNAERDITLRQTMKSLELLQQNMDSNLEELREERQKAEVEADKNRQWAYKEKERAKNIERSADVYIAKLSEDLKTKNEQLQSLGYQLESVKYTSSKQKYENATLKIQAADLKKEINQHKIDSLENYEIKEVCSTTTKVGDGSYGSVSMVIVNGMPCIQKRLHDILVGINGKEAVGEEQQKSISEKFYEECRLLWQMRHPNIVQFMGIHYHGEVGEIHKMSLIMEYLPTNVQDCITKCNSVKAVFAMSIKMSLLRDVAYGLSHLHANDIIHRDLSAANILLTYSMRAKIADLGVSKLVPLYAYSKFTTAPGATYIMPPEALEENPQYSNKLDIFSYGIFLLYLVLQKEPKPQNTTLKEEHLKKKQIEVGRRHSHVYSLRRQNPELEQIAIQCLQDEPHARPAAAALCTMLNECFQKAKHRYYHDLQDFLSSIGQTILVFPDY